VDQERRWRHLPVMLAALALAALGCNLTALLPGAPGATTPTPALGVPSVVINSPPNGSEAVRGQEVLVQSTAQDSIGVTRVELRVNSFIVNTVSSQASGGERLFSVIQSWIPSEAGVANLEVIAYRGLIASAPARVTVLVRQSASQVTATLAPPSGVTQAPPQDLTCRARVEVSGLNFRTGPDTNYPILRVLEAGTLVDIIGRLGDNSWWQVRSGLDIGWLSATYTSESGDCSLIPVAVPPPSPTPRPATATPTATFTLSPIPGSPTPTFTPTPTVPDLVVSAIIGPEVLQLNATGTVSARYTVRVYNQGTGNSGQFTTSFRQPDGTVIQLPIVVNLAPGQYADLGLDVTFTASNTYRLEAFVDSGAQVAESDEGNNIRTLNVVVTTLPALMVTLPGGGLAVTPMFIVPPVGP